MSFVLIWQWFCASSSNHTLTKTVGAPVLFVTHNTYHMIVPWPRCLRFPWIPGNGKAGVNNDFGECHLQRKAGFNNQLSTFKNTIIIHHHSLQGSNCNEAGGGWCSSVAHCWADFWWVSSQANMLLICVLNSLVDCWRFSKVQEFGGEMEKIYPPGN